MELLDERYFNEYLLKCKNVSETIVDYYVTDVISTNECMNSMSELMLKVCKENLNSRKIINRNAADIKTKKSEWCDQVCR